MCVCKHYRVCELHGTPLWMKIEPCTKVQKYLDGKWGGKLDGESEGKLDGESKGKLDGKSEGKFDGKWCKLPDRSEDFAEKPCDCTEYEKRLRAKVCKEGYRKLRDEVLRTEHQRLRMNAGASFPKSGLISICVWRSKKGEKKFLMEWPAEISRLLDSLTPKQIQSYSAFTEPAVNIPKAVPPPPSPAVEPTTKSLPPVSVPKPSDPPSKVDQEKPQIAPTSVVVEKPVVPSALTEKPVMASAPIENPVVPSASVEKPIIPTALVGESVVASSDSTPAKPAAEPPKDPST